MVVVGAKGFAKQLLPLLSELNLLDGLCFFDNVSEDLPEKLFGRFRLVRTLRGLEEELSKDQRYVMGVGGPLTRYELATIVNARGGVAQTIVSKSAVIGPFETVLGRGTIVLFNAIVECSVHIGDGALINNAAIISHDVSVGQYCEVSPGAKVLGRAIIGDFAEIGSNAVILPRITIGSHCRVGAGAVVTKDVPDNTTVAGIPAKPL